MVKDDAHYEDSNRVTAVFEEVLAYDTVALSKISLANCEVLITVCGRNSWTNAGNNIVSVKMPLVNAIKKVKPVCVPVRYNTEQLPADGCAPVRLGQSWEETQGTFLVPLILFILYVLCAK